MGLGGATGRFAVCCFLSGPAGTTWGTSALCGLRTKPGFTAGGRRLRFLYGGPPAFSFAVFFLRRGVFFLRRGLHFSYFFPIFSHVLKS